MALWHTCIDAFDTNVTMDHRPNIGMHMHAFNGIMFFIRVSHGVATACRVYHSSVEWHFTNITTTTSSRPMSQTLHDPSLTSHRHMFTHKYTCRRIRPTFTAMCYRKHPLRYTGMIHQLLQTWKCTFLHMFLHNCAFVCHADFIVCFSCVTYLSQLCIFVSHILHTCVSNITTI
jgi:hypothetical protein